MLITGYLACPWVQLRTNQPGALLLFSSAPHAFFRFLRRHELHFCSVTSRSAAANPLVLSCSQAADVQSGEDCLTGSLISSLETGSGWFLTLGRSCLSEMIISHTFLWDHKGPFYRLASSSHSPAASGWCFHWFSLFQDCLMARTICRNSHQCCFFPPRYNNKPAVSSSFFYSRTP